MKVDEKFNFLVEKGSHLYNQSKTKTLKYVKQTILEIISYNRSIIENEGSKKPSVDFTDQSTNYNSKLFSRKDDQKSNSKEKRKKKVELPTIKYISIINIFSGNPSQTEDIIEFVLANDKNCEVSFLYR